MDDMPDFENESTVKLRWYIENFPSPHPFFKPAMAALEKKEAEEDSRRANQSAIHIRDSNVANLNVGSQVGAIAAQTTGHTTIEFNEQLRQMVRIADLEWSLLNKPGNRVAPQMLCKQVDGLRVALAILYGKCPNAVDSQPLRDAIEKLDATRNHRVGNLIGSQSEADQVSELMEAALTAVRAMIPDTVGRKPWRTVPDVRVDFGRRKEKAQAPIPRENTMHVVLDLDLDFFVWPIAYWDKEVRLSESEYSHASEKEVRHFLEQQRS